MERLQEKNAQLRRFEEVEETFSSYHENG